MKRIKELNGETAFRKFLDARFAWGTDPKNPHAKGTLQHADWQRDYDRAVTQFFIN